MYRISAAQRRFSISSRKALLAMALIVTITALPASAELGGTADTIPADQQHMKGTLRVSAASGYTVHEIKADSGTTVREFVSPAGTVFAVAWQGPFMPDLHQLLGNYFERYSQAAQARRARRSPLVLHDAGLVVEAGGHMRSFYGRAYVPQLAPPAIDLQSIK